MRWVDFKEVKEKVSIRDVLVYYNVQGLKEMNGKIVGPCPVHGGDSPTAFHVDMEKNIWHCFSKCRAGGNVLDLVAKREGISVREAALKLQDIFLADSGEKAKGSAPSSPSAPGEATATSSPGSVVPIQEPSVNNPNDLPANQESKPPANPTLPFTLNLAPDHPYLLKTRELDLATIQTFGLGYCPKGTMAGRIAIPIHDAEGVLVAYAGRLIKDSRQSAERPRYKFPKGFHKQLLLYNLHRARDEAAESGELVLVEGFFDVFQLHQAGYPNTVALMGCAMSLEQEALIRADSSKVTLFFDGDDSGRNCTEECLWRLVHDLHVRIIELEDGEQPDNLTSDRIRQLLG